MTAVTRYSATDPEAPLLLPAVGSLGTLLYTVLNAGYTGKSAAGWAIPFHENDYSKVVFQNGTGSRERFWQVTDDFSTNAQMAAIYGYETMSDLDVGTGKFPTDQQIVTPHYSSVMKNDSGTQAARYWIIYANHKLCFLLINPQATIDFSGAGLYVFGDFVSLSASDNYNSLLIGRHRHEVNTAYNGQAGLSCTIANTLDGHHLIRSFTQLGGSIRFGKHADNYKDGVNFPNPVDGSMIISRFWVTESSGVVRGYIPGMWHLNPAYTNFTHGDTFTGTGPLAGRTFEIIRVYQNALAIETSDTWYS